MTICEDCNLNGFITDGQYFAYTRYEPLGVVGQIIPVCLQVLCFSEQTVRNENQIRNEGPYLLDHSLYMYNAIQHQ